MEDDVPGCDYSSCLLETPNAYDVCLVTIVALLFCFYHPLISSAVNMKDIRAKAMNGRVVVHARTENGAKRTHFTVRALCDTKAHLCVAIALEYLFFEIKSFMKSKHSNPEVLRLGSEVKRLKSELALISPTSEFSSYFKTERILNKTLEQYDMAVAKEKMMQPSQVKVEMGVKVVAQAIGLLLLHTVSGVHAFCISSSVFWPFNFLLRFPSVWSYEGCNTSVPEHTPVSLFALVYCAIVAARNLLFSKKT